MNPDFARSSLWQGSDLVTRGVTQLLPVMPLPSCQAERASVRRIGFVSTPSGPAVP